MEAALSGKDDAPDTSALVRRIAAGDRDAEALLVRRFQSGILLLARRHARPNDARVHDICQNVLLRTIERLRAGALADPDALPGYLRTAVVREVVDLYRSSAAKRDGGDLDSAAAQAALVDPESPERRLGEAQIADAVRAAMTALPVARDREMLVRFYVHGHSRDAICADFAIDVAHFHRVMYRARERLRGALSASLGECR